MKRNEIQKEIKKRTDLIFTDYKGKLGIGGNIFHSKLTETGKNIIFQTVLKYDIFPTSCSLQIENNQLNTIYKNIFSTSEEIHNFSFGIHTIEKKIISEEKDIDLWIRKLETELENKEEIFAFYSNLDNLEKLINKQLLEHEIGEDFNLHEYQIINGLISAKICKRDYFEKLFAKFIKTAELKNFPLRTISNVKIAYEYLKTN